MKAATESPIFSFRETGHEVTEIEGHIFIQHQEHTEVKDQSGKFKQVPLSISKTPPIRYVFWGGEILTKFQIEDRLRAVKIVPVPGLVARVRAK